MTLTTDELRQIVETDHVQCGDAAAMARELLANREAQPVAIVGPSDYVTAAQLVGEGPARKAVHELYEGALVIGQHLYTSPPAPALPVQHWEELCRQHPNMSIGDAIIRAAWWNHCREELLNNGAQPAPAVPDESDPRDAFESVFPMPKYVVRCGAGYAVTAYSAWGARDFNERWVGWNACRAAMLAAVPEYDILEDYRAEMLKRVTFGGDGKSSCNANYPEIPEGWKLVPIDATRAMIDAAQRVEEDGYDAMHKAMIAAAPEGK
ncbi:hypothetical protein [Serratia sp. 201]|uniref:hypothetical protein n=1 Tax=Serratia sp. 201 TaxID=3096764 RepID=UPI00300BB67A